MLADRKMVPEIKARWLERLRSGTIQQGTSYLRSGDAMCCLGVLCELAVEAGMCRKDTIIDPNGPVLYLDNDGNVSAQTLPLGVREWAGLPSVQGFEVPEARDDDRMFGHRLRGIPPLSAVNDAGFTFAEIADLIEKYV